MTKFHEPDSYWQFADENAIRYYRWPFGVPCPFIWNGAAWVRWYGREFSEKEIIFYTSISDAFIVDDVYAFIVDDVYTP